VRLVLSRETVCKRQTQELLDRRWIALLDVRADACAGGYIGADESDLIAATTALRLNPSYRSDGLNGIQISVPVSQEDW
jgi:hypothetical protein